MLEQCWYIDKDHLQVHWDLNDHHWNEYDEVDLYTRLHKPINGSTNISKAESNFELRLSHQRHYSR